MSLELQQTTVEGIVRDYHSKSNKSNNGKTAHAKIELTFDEEEALRFGGKLFAKACFGDYVGKSGAVLATHKDIGGELEIKAAHSLVIGGYPISATPKISGVNLSTKIRAVTMLMGIDVPFHFDKLRRMLDDGNGDSITIEIKGVTQTEIPDGKRSEDTRMDFSEAEEGNGADEETGEQPEPMWDDADLDAVEAEA